MGKSKEKRIKKYKKKHIWPSIVGLSLILAIFSVILSAIMLGIALDIVEKKLADSSSTSLKIAKLFEGYNSDADGTEQIVLSHIDVLDKVEAVSVTDENENQLWSSNGQYPEKDKMLSIEILYDIIGENVGVVFEEYDENLIVFDEEVGLYVNENRGREK